MIPNRVLKNPNRILISDYEPGLKIACAPNELAFEKLPELEGIDIARQVQLCGRYLVDCGIAKAESDLLLGLQIFAGSTSIEETVSRSLTLLGVEDRTLSLHEALPLIIERLLAERLSTSATTVYCHRADEDTLLGPSATHFGFVVRGNAAARLHEDHTYPLYEGTYFSLAEPGVISGDAEIVVISHADYVGYTSVGGRIPPEGHLRYIDGCTDSLLVPPVKLGKPCFNALFFPPGTDQTQHYHPSLRAGIVVDGCGECIAPDGNSKLSKGQVFLIPADCWHSFSTDPSKSNQAALTVLASHPDSDFGPTDEDHPMLNRTYTHFAHYLRSAARMPAQAKTLHH